ncbi:MAG: hypothetical protein U9R08_02165 [Nanoarchaeota archaeon]|nr:hypothetical protein [Nanoarchaeota archaeon]
MYATAGQGTVDARVAQSPKKVFNGNESSNGLVKRILIGGLVGLSLLANVVNLPSSAPAAAIIISDLRSPAQVVEDYFSSKKLYNNNNNNNNTKTQIVAQTPKYFKIDGRRVSYPTDGYGEFQTEEDFMRDMERDGQPEPPWFEYWF